MEKPPTKCLVPETPKILDITTPTPNFTIPTKDDTSTKVIDRLTIEDVSKEFPSIQIQFIDPS